MNVAHLTPARAPDVPKQPAAADEALVAPVHAQEADDDAVIDSVLFCV